MADSAFKIDFAFSGCEKGWLETWYSLSGTAALAYTFAEGLANVRMNLIGDPVYIKAIRIQQVGVTPAKKPIVYNAKPDGTLWGKFQPALADQAGAAIYVRVQTANGQKRQMMLRACPDEWIQRNAINKDRFAPLTTAFKPQWDAFKAYLAKNANILAMKCLKKDGTGAPKNIVTIVEDNVTGYYKVTTSVAHTLGPGDDVIFRGMTGDNVANLIGKTRLFSASGSEMVAPRTPNAFQTIRVEKNGTVSKVVYEYIEVATLDPVGVTTRDTGGPVFRSRGRRRRRR